ncbi:hypothetical protein GUG23_04525, partial [Xanthomonas citri pv. citri]|nr:hypothetical protein [Xanthomonas citri pv. citri]MBD4725122.1 hypothetical protein [Xanthomonas citri pv. citri]
HARTFFHRLAHQALDLAGRNVGKPQGQVYLPTQTPLPPTRSSRHLLPSIAQPLHRLPAHACITQLLGFCSAKTRQCDDGVRWGRAPLTLRFIAQHHVLDALAVTHHARMRVRAVLLAVEGRGVVRHRVIRLLRWRNVLACCRAGGRAHALCMRRLHVCRATQH